MSISARSYRLVILDNYDSFVYNLVHYLVQIGAEVDVWRNDDQRFGDPGYADGYSGILLSPGPGTPEQAGVCVELIKEQGGRLPIFGDLLSLPVAAGDAHQAPEALENDYAGFVLSPDGADVT